jgi:NAD(P)-dependent dehydrogenase (short-subunit alcohol dehydrogenase family)
VKISTGRPGLTRQNQAVPQIVSLEDVARRHIDLTLDDGRHARTAAAFPARMGHVNARIEHHVDQALTTWPGQSIPLTVQVDLDVCTFCHAPNGFPSQADGRPARPMAGKIRPEVPVTGNSAWRTMLDVNLTGVWHTCRAGAPHLVARGGGAMVLTNSIAGLSSLDRPPTRAEFAEEPVV